MDIFEKFREYKIIPVVTVKSADKAVPLATALVDGGLPCAEITFRVDGASKCIYEMTKAYPDMIVGAGTVLTKKQADEAIEAGAKFIVSPGFNRDVVKHCIDKGAIIIPGVCTPTEIEAALSLGIKCVKFFPAEQSGGVKMIKALTAPYNMITIMPTGGITLENIMVYLSLKPVICCGGTWMTPNELIEDGDFDAIKKLVEESVSVVSK